MRGLPVWQAQHPTPPAAAGRNTPASFSVLKDAPATFADPCGTGQHSPVWWLPLPSCPFAGWLMRVLLISSCILDTSQAKITSGATLLTPTPQELMLLFNKGGNRSLLDAAESRLFSLSWQIMLPREEIKTRMQLDSLLFASDQLSEETGSIRNCCKHLILSSAFQKKERVARHTGRVEKKKMWEETSLQDPTPAGDRGSRW